MTCLTRLCSPGLSRGDLILLFPVCGAGRIKDYEKGPKQQSECRLRLIAAAIVVVVVAVVLSLGLSLLLSLSGSDAKCRRRERELKPLQMVADPENQTSLMEEGAGGTRRKTDNGMASSPDDGQRDRRRGPGERNPEARSGTL